MRSLSNPCPPLLLTVVALPWDIILRVLAVVLLLGAAAAGGHALLQRWQLLPALFTPRCACTHTHTHTHTLTHTQHTQHTRPQLCIAYTVLHVMFSLCSLKHTHTHARAQRCRHRHCG